MLCSAVPDLSGGLHPACRSVWKGPAVEYQEFGFNTCKANCLVLCLLHILILNCQTLKTQFVCLLCVIALHCRDILDLASPPTPAAWCLLMQ